jgi:hypothetical protein
MTYNEPLFWPLLYSPPSCKYLVSTLVGSENYDVVTTTNIYMDSTDYTVREE